MINDEKTLPVTVPIVAEGEHTAVGGSQPVTARGRWGRALRAAIAWNLPELSRYSPTAVHLPAEAHEMPLRSAWGLVPVFEGAVTWAACSLVPLVSVASIA